MKKNQTLTFIILQKIKEKRIIQGKTITEIAKQLGTSRNLMQSIIFKIKKYQDILNLVDEFDHKNKNELLKYKDFFVFREKNYYVVVFKKSDEFKKLMDI